LTGSREDPEFLLSLPALILLSFSLFLSLSFYSSHSKADPLISLPMWKMVIGQAIFQIAVNLLLLYYAPVLFGLDMTQYEDQVINRTLVFNTFIFMQVFNEINSRKIDDCTIFLL